MDSPVPFRATVCGLPGASSVNDRVPCRAPLAVGLKAMVTLQFAPGCTWAPQVLVWMMKSPLMVTLEIFSVAVPVLVRVTLLEGLVCPIGVLAKVSLVAERLTIGPPPPLQVLKVNDPMFVLQLKLPLTFSYWSTYQKVQSSEGSTCMAL